MGRYKACGVCAGRCVRSCGVCARCQNKGPDETQKCAGCSNRFPRNSRRRYCSASCGARARSPVFHATQVRAPAPGMDPTREQRLAFYAAMAEARLPLGGR